MDGLDLAAERYLLELATEDWVPLPDILTFYRVRLPDQPADRRLARARAFARSLIERGILVAHRAPARAAHDPPHHDPALSIRDRARLRRRCQLAAAA